MIRSISIAAAALSLSLTITPAAHAFGCDEFGCGLNGTHLTGVRLPSATDITQRQASEGDALRQPAGTATTPSPGEAAEPR